MQALGSLLYEIFELHDAVVLDEAKKILSKKEKKQKKYAAFKKKSEARGKNISVDSDEHEKGSVNKTVSKKLNRGELKSVPKGHAYDKKAKKATRTTGKQGNAKFANDSSFKDTRSDAHLHTDGDCKKGLRARTPVDQYAKHAPEGVLKKKPCKKSYPMFASKGDKARVLGSYRMALQNKDKEAIGKIETRMRSMGLKPHGGLWNERPECKRHPLPPGWRKKDCEPHGEGGADEWVRKFKPHKSRVAALKHSPTMRHPKHFGAGRLPKKHMSDHDYAKHGGHWGEKKVAWDRNKAGGERFGKASDAVAGARWAREKLKKTGQYHGSELGHEKEKK